MSMTFEAALNHSITQNDDAGLRTAAPTSSATMPI
jgi:hypothetical protein